MRPTPESSRAEPSPLRNPETRNAKEAIALYVRIASILKGKILRSEWPYGFMIPGINELAETYGVARATARQALQSLVSAGLIASERGRGSYVIHRAVPPEESDTGLFRDVAPTPAAHRISIIERKHAVPLPAPLVLNGRPFESYTLIRKVHSLRGVPYGYFEGYVPSQYYARFPARADSKEKLLFLLCQVGVSVDRRREILTIHTADWQEASYLQGDMAMPIARVFRVMTDVAERIVYAANNIYRGDRFRQDRTLRDGLLEDPKAVQRFANTG